MAHCTRHVTIISDAFRLFVDRFVSHECSRRDDRPTLPGYVDAEGLQEAVRARSTGFRHLWMCSAAPQSRVAAVRNRQIRCIIHIWHILEWDDLFSVSLLKTFQHLVVQDAVCLVVHRLNCVFTLSYMRARQNEDMLPVVREPIFCRHLQLLPDRRCRSVNNKRAWAFFVYSVSRFLCRGT